MTDITNLPDDQLYIVRDGGWMGKTTKHRDLSMPTRRQLQTLVAFAAGKSCSEVAQAHGVSVNSVKHHLRDAAHKLRLTSARITTMSLVMHCIKQGIITPLLLLLALAGPMITDDDLRRNNPPRNKPAARLQIRARLRENWETSHA